MSGQIRTKTIKTNHGVIKTPFFMPDATRGLVKLLSQDELEKAGTVALVVNTLHLYLQPGLSIIKKSGGIHKFMNWPGPLLSDSGGYQVFSLIHKDSKMGKITDSGAVFRSPQDGTKHVLTPEKSIQIQFDLETDMMVCLDDCPPNEFGKKDLARAVERTVSWAKRCRIEYVKQVKKRKIAKRKRPLLFGVIQGGEELDLRKKCAEGLLKIGFDGFGFGGRPVNKKGRFLTRVLEYTADLIPRDSLRFALGVGTPKDIARCAKLGWDMFDCVIPTREGRHGRLFFVKGKKIETVNITNSQFAYDFSPINKKSRIRDLRENSLAFLHHLFKINEPLGARLASLNNLEFYNSLMKKIKR